MSELFQKIQEVLAKIHYGNITLIIHDSRVVRIEAVEKIRLESSQWNHPMEPSKEKFVSQKEQGHSD